MEKINRNFNIPYVLRRIIRTADLSIFLSECRICGNLLVLANENIICSECRASLIMTDDPCCRICSCPLGNDVDICGKCLVDPPPFQKHLSFTPYKGLIKKLILLYKYGQVEGLKHLFTSLLLELYKEKCNRKIDAIIPVPQDRGRKREFSPIMEITQLMSNNLKIEHLPDVLVKVKKTVPQAGLGKSRRLKNLDGAFKLQNPVRLEGKTVLLIDDVYTTGTTVRKCAALLRRFAAEVVVMTLART